MLLGRVIGRVVPVRRHAGPGRRSRCSSSSRSARTAQPKGKTLVAADPTRMAGEGELVAYEGGREAALLLDPWFVPVDHAIVGIVDALHLPGKEKA